MAKMIHPDIHFVFPVAGSDKPVSQNFIGPFRELLQDNPYFFENELYEAIGYPEYQDYGPSCLEPGAEDGQLDYAGFSVFTLVQDQVETITEVLKDGEF